MITYSLIFGLTAWGLALAAIVRKQSRVALVMGSFLCCCVSAMWQFFEIQKRVMAGDFAGIEDTIGAIILGIGTMMAVTLVLDLLALKKK